MNDACYCDYESPSVFHAELRRARKPHKCGECGSAIQPGETYENVWGIWNGCPETYKTCQRCLELRNYVSAHVPCFCLEYGNMLECATETLREYAHESPGLWFGGARLLVKINKARRAA